MRNLLMLGIFLASSLSFIEPAQAAGTATVSKSTRSYDNGVKTRVVSVAITADAADGSVPDTTISGIHGCLMKVITNPGTPAPTDNYDIELLDPDDATADGAKALLANRDTANTEVVYPLSEAGSAGGLYFQPGTYTLKVTNNAVNSATVVLKMFFTDCH